MIKKNGFRYSDDGISYPDSYQFPDLICKYYGLNSNSLDAFLNNYLYASHPLQLNDILDSRHDLFSFKNKPSEEFYSQLRHSDLYIKDIDGSMLKRLFWKEETANFGIISLSINDHDSLMWPHYTQEKGFMIEFKTDTLIDSLQKQNESEVFLFTPINYLEKVIRLKILPTFNELKAITYYIFNTKSIQWKYENEWRIFIARNQMAPPKKSPYYHDYKFKKKTNYNKRLIYYSSDSIKKIVWGNDFISSLGKYDLENSGQIRFRYNRKQKNIFKTLVHIAEDFQDKFYISFLKIQKDNMIMRYNRKCNIHHDRKSIIIEFND